MTMSDDQMPRRFTDITKVAVTGSTNTDILQLGRQGAPEGVVIVAGSQTAGRGRRGREWVAPAGSGLLFSVLLRPRAAVAGLITPMAAVAVADAAAELGAKGLCIKWPNDVVVASDVDRGQPGPERKIAGILAEADWTSSAADGPRRPGPDERVLVSLGIGMNLKTGADFPDEVVRRRIALEELAPGVWDADTVLAELLTSLDRWYTLALLDGSALLDAWRDRCVTLGRRVRVDLGSSDLIGSALDIDADGRLIVRDDRGEDHVVAAGDVVHLRNAE